MSTRRASSSSRKPTARQGGAAPKKRPQQRRAKRAGILDHAVAAIPVSEATLRRMATWAITGVSGAIILGVAAWIGIPGAVGVAMAEGVGRAGFRVDQIEISGISRMDRMSVYAVALDQQARALPLVDLNKVRERLLQFGWIQDARVSRRLPDTLVVDIVERTPAAVWQNNGQLMLIDGAGVALEPVRADAMPDLPLVIGENANGQEQAYRTLLEAAPALKPLVRAATWVGNRRWDLTFNTNEKLSLPEGEKESARALTKFAELDGTQRLLGRGYLKFDMRDPDKLVVRTTGKTMQKDVLNSSPTTTGNNSGGDLGNGQ